jgi:transposase
MVERDRGLRMRGTSRGQGEAFSYVRLEARIPADHPLRPIRTMTDQAIEGLSRRLDRLYAPTGRPSIPPEHLLRALVLQVLFSVRSERLLMEQLEYNLLFRWFVGLAMDDAVWDVTVFTKNRERLLQGEIAEAFFGEVIKQARAARLLSDEHFTVDGTLLEAWASHKSFRPRDGSGDGGGSSGGGDRDFHGERRLNETHASTTDPEARLYKKAAGTAAKLCFMGHLALDNRHGLVVRTETTLATGTAEREAAERMLRKIRRRRRATAGADKAYDTRDHIRALRDLGITPHTTQNQTNRSSAIDARTTRHAGYEISQRKRKLVEQPFGWMKTVGLMRKVRHRGRRKVGWVFTFTAAVYDMVRIRSLLEAPT